LVMTKSSPWKIAVFGSKSSINRPCSSIFHIANSQITGEYPHTHIRSSTASSATNEPFCPGHGAIHKVRRQTTQPLGMKSWPRSHWYEYIYIHKSRNISIHILYHIILKYAWWFVAIFITVILQHIVSNCSYHMKSYDNMLYKYALLYVVILPYIMLYSLI
jgi:hypothetical protein